MQTSSPSPFDDAFFARDAVTVAAELIGAALHKGAAGGIIVETEAYRADDEASHSFRGQTARNAAMFGPPGTIYVYRSYGIHWCVNFVCEAGSAVLIRALEPTEGVEAMRARRGLTDIRRLAAGPGRLCQALGIDGADDGRHLSHGNLRLGAPARRLKVACGRRIGISKAVDLPWRFAAAGSPFVSKPVRIVKE